MPLNKLVQMLSDQHKIPFMLDAGGLDRANVQPDTPITASYLELPLNIILRQILRRLHLRHYVRNGRVVITDRMIQAPAAPARVVRQQVLPNGQVIIFNGNRAVVGPMIAPQQRLVPQLQALLNVEAILVKKVCTPTKEQMRQIKEEMEEFVNQAADEYVSARQGLVAPSEGTPSSATVLNSRTDGGRGEVAVISRADHPLSQRGRKKALFARGLHRNLVAILDSELYLSKKQRSDLCRAAVELGGRMEPDGRDGNDQWSKLCATGSRRRDRPPIWSRRKLTFGKVCRSWQIFTGTFD